MPISSSVLLPDRPLHIGIFGATAARLRFGRALSLISGGQVQIAGIVDEDARNGRAWSRELPGKPPVFATPDQLLLGAPQLDAVVVSAAFSQRISVAETFLEEGVSVLTEFPNAVSLNALDSAAMLGRANSAALVPLLLHRCEEVYKVALSSIEAGAIGTPLRLKSEISMPLNPAACLESGLIPTGADWYDMLQIVAFRSMDYAMEVLGGPRSVNADFDLPQHADMVGRRQTDPIANIIAGHDNGQSTHLLKLSRSVHPYERYLFAGERGILEMVLSHGETGATVNGPELYLHRTGSRPKTLYSTEVDIESTSYRNERALLAGLQLLKNKEDGVQRLLAARGAMEAVHAAFVSAKEGIRIPLPLIPAPDIDALLQL